MLYTYYAEVIFRDYAVTLVTSKEELDALLEEDDGYILTIIYL